MKYQLLGNYTGDLIETILHNRNIFDVGKILNPTNENDTNVFDLPNIYEGVEIYTKNLTNKILILVDSDVDGFTSAAIIYKYTKYLNPLAEINFYVHDNKAHGLTKKFINHIDEIKPNLVIVTDAGTNDIEQREEIINKGIDLLIIDHHNEERETKNGGIMINNHANFPQNDINKHLTGAGMTFLFCKALEDKFNTGKLDKLKDLAMLGLIGDSANLIDNEIRRLCFDGIKNVNSNLLKTFCIENNKNEDNLTFKDLSFGGIIPLINAVVRVGDIDERKLVFKALVDLDTDYFEVVSKRKLNKETRKYEMKDFNYNIYQLALDAGDKCKNKQNKVLTSEMKKSEKQFNSETGIQIFVTNQENKGLTGLIANKLKSQWEQPTLVLWVNDDKTVYNGSLRGHEKTMASFKNWCEQTELFDLIQGHDNAAGVVLKTENLDKLIEKAKCVEAEEMSYKIDMMYQDNANINHIFELHNNKHIFGNGIDEPLFAIKDLKVKKSQITWTKNTLRLKADNITYIKFGVNEQEYENLKAGNQEIATFDVVGRFEVNEWNGRKFPQVIIVDYETKTEKEENIFGNTSFFDYGMFA